MVLDHMTNDKPLVTVVLIVTKNCESNICSGSACATLEEAEKQVYALLLSTP